MTGRNLRGGSRVLGSKVFGLDAGGSSTIGSAAGTWKCRRAETEEARSTVQLLRNAVRPYAWGSRTAIADLLGRPVPAPHPEAELWMGAHPGDPSRLVRDDGSEISLLRVLDSDPARQLGSVCLD